MQIYINKIIITLFIFKSFLFIDNTFARNHDNFSIDNIVINGNKNITDKEILSIMQLKKDGFFTKNKFDNLRLNNDIKKITLYYKEKGFLNVKCKYMIKKDTLKHKITIYINITEGTLFVIKQINFEGNKYFNSKYLLNNIKISINQPFNIFTIEQAKLQIIDIYRAVGFLNAFAEFTTNSVDKKENIVVNFIIKEGIRYKVNSIKVTGLEKTKQKVVLREFTLENGDYYSQEALTNAQRRLYKTGLFYSVNLKYVPAANGDSTQKDVIVAIKEYEPGEFEVSLGYGSVEKIRLTSSISYNNFWGRAYRGILLGRVSSLEKRLETTFIDPWFCGLPIEGSAGFEVSQENQPSYDLLYYNSKLFFLKEFNIRFTSSILFEYGTGKYNDIKLSFYKGINDTLDLSDSLIVNLLQNLDYSIDRAGIKLSLFRDFRDNIFNPWERGHYIDLSIQYIQGYANLLFFEKYKSRLLNQILKFNGNFRYYLPIWYKGLLASAIDFGIMEFFNSSKINFLLSDLYYAGGPNSLRGFSYRGIGPKDKNGISMGGRLKIVWNALEYRQKIFDFLESAVFIDIGNVWAYYYDFRWDNIRIDFGAGIRLNSPIGIVRFDYAINPFPQGNETSYQFWFGIGQAF